MRSKYSVLLMCVATIALNTAVTAFAANNDDVYSTLSTADGLPLCGSRVCSRGEHYNRLLDLRSRQTSATTRRLSAAARAEYLARSEAVTQIWLEQLKQLNRFRESVPTASRNSTLSLAWVIPTQREDGSGLPLANLLRYEIHLRYNWQNRVQVFKVDDPRLSSTVVTGLLPGRAWVQMVSVDASGLASDLSAPVAVIIQ